MKWDCSITEERKKSQNLERNSGRRTVNKVELNLGVRQMKHAIRQYARQSDEGKADKPGEQGNTHLLFHVTEPERAAEPPVDAWQAAEFFWWL